MIEWVDIVCVQETKREQFSNKHSTFTATGWLAKPLEKLSATNCSKGGMLIGVNLDVMDADLIGEGQFLHGV